MNPQAEANAIYAPALQAIQQQTPQIQQLYQTLVQGLQQQSMAQQQNVVNSAAQRGLTAPTLGTQVAGAYGQDLNLLAAQLNAQRATDTAGINQQLGKTNVAKATSVNDLAQSLLKQNMENQQNQYQLSDIERKAQLEQQQNQQNFEIQKARYEQAQREAAARAAASAREATISQADFERAIRLRTPRGEDNYANPHVLAERYVQWKQQGFNEDDFWKAFQGWWNPKDSSYNDSFYSTVRALGG